MSLTDNPKITKNLPKQEKQFTQLGKDKVATYKDKDTEFVFVPGMFDTVENSANTYNQINSDLKYDSRNPVVKNKIDTNTLGYRSSEGNKVLSEKDKREIALTDRLAKEREELLGNFSKESFGTKYKQLPNTDYVTDSTGKYIIGKVNARTKPMKPDGEPTRLNSRKLESAQDTAVVMGDSHRSNNKNTIQVLTKPKESKEYTLNPGLTEKFGHTMALNNLLIQNNLKAIKEQGKVKEYVSPTKSYSGKDTIPVTISPNKQSFVIKKKGGLFNFIK